MNSGCALFSSLKRPRDVALVQLHDSVRAGVIHSAFQLCRFYIRVTTAGIDPSTLPGSGLAEAGIKWKCFFFFPNNDKDFWAL